MVQAVILPQREDGDDGQHRDEDRQRRRGLDGGPVLHQRTQAEHQGDRADQGRGHQEKGGQHQPGAGHQAARGHAGGRGQTHADHGQGKGGQGLGKGIVAGAAEAAVHQHPAEESAQLAEGEHTDGQEGEHGQGKEVFHHVPQPGHEHHAEHEADVHAHGHGQRHGHELRFGVGRAELGVGLTPLPGPVAAQVPQQVLEVENGVEGDPGHGHDNGHAQGEAARPEGGDNILEQGHRPAGMGYPVHQPHEKGDHQASRPQGDEKVQGRIGVGRSGGGGSHHRSSSG